MSIIDPPASWADVDGINTNERLLGGPSGPLNRAVTDLTARTNQLRVWRDEDVEAVAADKAALASAVGASLVGYTGPGAGAVARTLQAKEREWVTVTDFAPEGTLGLGTDDDTEAFRLAVNSGAKLVFVPPAPVYYRVKELVVPSGVGLRGLGRRRVYNPLTLTDMVNTGATVVMLAGASFCVEFAGLNNVEDMNFHGLNRTCHGLGVTPGNGLNFRNVSMVWFNRGFGSNTYIRNSRFWNCHAAQNVNGGRDFVDSHWYGGEINANTGAGVYMGTGANDTVFVGTKNEWNGGNNWTFFNSFSCAVIGGVTDRAANHGVEAIGSRLILDGIEVRRSGANGTGVHFNFGANSSVVMTGVTTAVGANDDGSGATTPAYSLRMDGTTIGKLRASACDLAGFVTGFISGALTGNYRFSACDGILNTRDFVVFPTNGDITDAGTLVVPLTTTALPASGRVVRRLGVQINTRNNGTGAVSTNRFNVQIARGGSNATAAVVWVEQTGNTEINTSAANVLVTVGNVAADGSTFDLTLNATTARQVNYQAWSD